MHHLVNEYKEGKAYRYFTNKWVKEVFFHPVSETLPYCILKCRCTPSQRVSSKPYHVWVIAEKDSKDKPGGKIISTYCTCTAGLHGSCNHIAGLLFRVESAVLRGITKPTCTDRLARWTSCSSCKNRTMSTTCLKADLQERSLQNLDVH